MACDSTAIMSTTIPSFLDKIPPEIRKIIYKEFFQASTVNIIHFSRKFERNSKAACVNLLLVSKQIHDEAEEEYRKHTEFHALSAESPWPSLLASKDISNLTIFNSNEAYLDRYNQMIANRDRSDNSQKMLNLTIVCRYTIDKFTFMTELDPRSPLGKNTKKLTQIVDFKSRIFHPLVEVPLPTILKAINPRNPPPYGPVWIAVVTTVQNANAKVSTKLEIFAPEEIDVKYTYRFLTMDTRGRTWLRAPSEIVVWLTGSWPYKRIDAGTETDVTTGMRTITWEDEEVEMFW